jgi:bifunctional non-homologous end joining protein LigD
VPPEQLPLPDLPPAEAPRLRLPDRIAPMQPTTADAPFDDPDYLFEPWWPGVRATAFAERGRVRLQVAGLADADAAFPELRDLPAQLAEDGVAIDGTLLVLDAEGRPDGELLRARLTGAGKRPGRAAYVASDLLWAGGQPVLKRRFRVRRDWLAAILAPGDRITVGHGYVGDGTLVAEALARFGIDGLSGRRLSARHHAGAAGDAWLRMPVVAAEPRPRPTLALLLRLPLVEPQA